MKTKAIRDNKTIAAEINKSSKPKMGANTPVGKDSKDNMDATKNEKLQVVKVREAVEVPNIVRAAHEKQDGKNLDNAPHAQSGCSTNDE
jgi:hypothetical protein